jgi:hypothetical protein
MENDGQPQSEQWVNRVTLHGVIAKPGVSVNVPALRGNYCEARVRVLKDTFDVYAVGPIADQLASACQGRRVALSGELVKDKRRVGTGYKERIRVRIESLELDECRTKKGSKRLMR